MSTDSTIVLIHSPLVGPASWRWVADELRTTGFEVIVPSLVPEAVAGSWEGFVHAAAQAHGLHDDVILVGHSGAGPLLPVIADSMDRRPSLLVFVDAGVPPERGVTASIPAEFVDHLRSLARDGVLPRWSEWFGPDAITTLIPDEDRRHAVVADMPELPLSYFDAPIALPEGWAEAMNNAYVLLSDIYRPDAENARAQDRPVIELSGGHMAIVSHPRQVADAIAGFAVR